MAKKNNEVIIDTPVVDNPVDNVEKSSEEVVVVENVVPKAMNVEIIPTDSFRACIGGTRYEFVKNQKVKVPADVERFLRERDLIK